jgi:hypothetical protein
MVRQQRKRSGFGLKLLKGVGRGLRRASKSKHIRAVAKGAFLGGLRGGIGQFGSGGRRRQRGGRRMMRRQRGEYVRVICTQRAHVRL